MRFINFENCERLYFQAAKWQKERTEREKAREDLAKERQRLIFSKFLIDINSLRHILKIGDPE